MKRAILILWCAITAQTAISQVSIKPGQSVAAIVRLKNYPFLFMVDQDPEVSLVIKHDTVLARLRDLKRDKIRSALRDCAAAPFCLTEALRIDPEEIRAIGARLSEISRQTGLGQFIDRKVIPTGAYHWRLEKATGEDRMRLIWEQDAAGINHVLSVYASGSRPNYPLIDSNSLNISSAGQFPRGYANQLQQILHNLLDVDSVTGGFMTLQTAAVNLFLSMNGRNQAADYEPMERGVNKHALKRADTLNWKRFPYSVILVPGAGPADHSVKLTPEAIIRMELAVSAYKKGMAPFIMVSGGKVHPFKTEVNEAMEMKLYLTHVLGIPASSVIMEPHARHTTTNIRNAARLMIRYRFPIEKPGLACSTVGQSMMITSTLPGRCIKELGYVPYRNGQRLDQHFIEFYALKTALQADPDEPIDP
jgi:hypothetical protein